MVNPDGVISFYLISFLVQSQETLAKSFEAVISMLDVATQAVSTRALFSPNTRIVELIEQILKLILDTDWKVTLVINIVLCILSTDMFSFLS